MRFREIPKNMSGSTPNTPVPPPAPYPALKELARAHGYSLSLLQNKNEYHTRFNVCWEFG